MGSLVTSHCRGLPEAVHPRRMVSAGKSETTGMRRISRPICVGKIEITPVLPGAFFGTKICHIPYSKDETSSIQSGIASKSPLTIQEFVAIYCKLEKNASFAPPLAPHHQETIRSLTVQLEIGEASCRIERIERTSGAESRKPSRAKSAPA